MPSIADRLEFAPPHDKGSLRALGLALLVHVLLIAALTWGVNWKSSDDAAAPFQAELWSALPQQAAPKAPAEPPPPAPPPTPAPAPVVPLPPPPAPPPPRPVKEPEIKEAPPVPDADIALEKEKEKKRKLQQQHKEAELQKAQKLQEKHDAELQAKKDKELKAKEALAQQKAEEKADLKKQQARELAKEKEKEKRTEAANAAAAAKAEQQKEAAAASAAAAKQKQAAAAAAAAEKARQANIARMMGQAGATGPADAKGTAAKASGASSGYKGLIRAAVKPNIIFADEITGNPVAVIEVRTTSDGTIMSQRLVKSSGNKAWDEAAVKAIIRTGAMPRDIDGRIPETVLLLELRPRD